MYRKRTIIKAGIDAEVKIIQRWNGFRPDYRLLLGHFYADLVGQNQQRYRQQQQRLSRNSEIRKTTKGQDYGPIEWIETLLQTPIDDYRKHTRDLIVVPYLVVRRGNDR